MPPVQRTYSITDCLGRGGFGEVYSAEASTHANSYLPVALKVLRRDLSPGSQAVQRLHDEARALARLNHPAIVRVFDLVTLDGRVTLVTELLDGDDLTDCIRGPDRMQVRALVEVIGTLADALEAAYNAPLDAAGTLLRLIHRDVKPSNVRIGRGGDVRLLDFGIARSDEVTREAFTMSDVLVGSPQYMAPERFVQTEPDPASDVFSLGAILVEGLTGSRLFGFTMPILASMAIDRDRYEQHVRQQLDLVPAGPVRELAASMVGYAAEGRPTAGQVAAICDRLRESLDGPALVDFCRARRWRGPRGFAGDLVGRVLSDQTEVPAGEVPFATFAAPTQLLPEASAVARPRPSEVTTQRELPLRRGRPAVGLVIGVGALGLAAALGATILSGSAAHWAAPGQPVVEASRPPVARATPRAAVVPAQTVPAPASALPIASTRPGTRSGAEVHRGAAVLSAPPAPVPAEPAAPLVDERAPPEPKAPDPVPERLVHTSVAIDGVAAAGRLSGARVVVTLPGAVSPGPYDLEITWLDGRVDRYAVSIPPGESHVITCRTRMRTCR